MQHRALIDRTKFNLDEALKEAKRKQALHRLFTQQSVPEQQEANVELTADLLSIAKMHAQFIVSEEGFTMSSGNRMFMLHSIAAIRENNQPDLWGYIKRYKDYDNSYDSNMNSLLHYAAFYGHSNIIKLLIENKMTVADQNRYGLQPIHIAAFFGHMDAVKILLESGATDLQLVDIEVKAFSFKCIPLYLAILNNQVEMATYLLNRCTMPALTVEGLGNIYHLLALQANEGVLDSLLQSEKLKERADINFKYNDFTPYSLAIYTRNANAVSGFAKLPRIVISETDKLTAAKLFGEKIVQDDKEVDGRQLLSGVIKADFNLYDITSFGKIHTIQKHIGNTIKIETEKGLEVIYEGESFELIRNRVHIDNKPIEANDARLLQFSFQSNTAIVKQKQLKCFDPILIAPNKKMFWENSSSADSSQQETNTLTYKS